MDDMERRAFIKGAAFGAFAFTVGGATVMLTPRQAHADKVPLRTLTADQAATLDAMGETLVPGAKEAGITNFVDLQLSIPAEEALLQARILNVRPPYANFYRAALGAIDGASDKTKGRKFAQLTPRRAARFHQPDAAEQNRRLARAARAVRLHGAAQRCRRCRLCHDGRLCGARRALHAAYRADEEVVT